MEADKRGLAVQQFPEIPVPELPVQSSSFPPPTASASFRSTASRLACCSTQCGDVGRGLTSRQLPFHALGETDML